MPFDHEAEANEPAPRLDLIFKSGRSKEGGLPMPPSAYIAMGWWSTDDEGRPRLTTEEMSFDTLKAQVDLLKGLLDARLAEAKAQFEAANSRAS
jgi:hypothetical protein